MKKRTVSSIKLLLIACVVFLTSTAFLGILITYYNSEKPYEIIKEDFSEKSLGHLILNGDEHENIFRLLSEKYISEKGYAGFSAYSSMYSLSDVHGLSKCLLEFGDIPELVARLRTNLQDLEGVNLESLTMLDFFYYLSLCRELDLPLNMSSAEEKLNGAYDTKSKLFNLFAATSSIHDNIWLSGNICELASGYGNFDVVTGLISVLKNYNFKLPKDNDTLYNSGGDIIYALNQCGISAYDFTEYDISSWYEAWKLEFHDFVITDEISALIYSGFLDIAQIIDISPPYARIAEYYNSLTPTSIDSGYFDPQIWAQIIKYVPDKHGNKLFYTALHNMLVLYVDEVTFETKNIDIEATAFGVLLADAVGFDYDKEAVIRTMHNYYEMISYETDTTRLSRYLYYYVLVMEILDDYSIQFINDVFVCNIIQNRIDYVFNQLKFQEYALSDFRTAKMTLEVVSNLQMFDCDVKLKTKYARKIVNALEQHKDNVEFLTAEIAILFRIDYILKSNILSRSKLDEIVLGLVKEGGITRFQYSAFPPDLLSTYGVFTCIRTGNDFSLIYGMQEFVRTLKTLPGIYCLMIGDNATLKSVYYGNSINGFIPASPK